MAPAYVEPLSGRLYPLEVPRWRSDDGLPLMITPLPGIGRGDIAAERRSLWRYAAALPFPIPDPVTMGEGCTPLVERSWDGARALFKLEWFSPTGSFKDRGASVMISALRQQGVARLLEDSSGNGGAAIAAYAAAGGLQAKILVPASTSPAKTVQMRAYGAEIELVPGTRQDTADEAIRQAEAIFYASHNWQAFFLQGTKTLAYELWEDSDFSGARQHRDSHRGRQQRARPRHRLRRIAAPRRDRAPAPAVRRPARELRADLSQPRGRRDGGFADRAEADDRRRDRYRQAGARA